MCRGRNARLTVLRCAAAVVAIAMLLGGCTVRSGAVERTTDPVPDRDLEMLIPTADAIDAVMGVAMSPQPVVDHMSDNRNLVTNVSCLGIWHVGEAAVYGEQDGRGWSAMRRQTLRAPDAEDWTSQVVQAVIGYPSAQAAQAFFTQSADRWAHCTDHTVNITLNGQALPKWRSGRLDRSADRLAIGVSRGVGEQLRSCQRVLTVAANVVVDVEACRAGAAAVDQADRIASLIESGVR
ncbi:sensor domain-containing protein [Mycobacterium sp. WMMD1722]|uniref:sensor domain-containing protein n=1 Tax=Mycobacterium sp. WMMD1722 TaxID=3404117 RepID=UPI003BF60960